LENLENQILADPTSKSDRFFVEKIFYRPRPLFYTPIWDTNHYEFFTEAAKQVIRKSEYAPIKRDHVIVRQGEVGDWYDT
jgi:hypothetical protein